MLTSDVAQARENCSCLSGKIGVRFSRAAGKRALPQMNVVMRERPRLSFRCFWERLGVPRSPSAPAASLLLCSGWRSWSSCSCTVPKCHRGSCLLRRLGFAPRPQPASPVGYHQLTCEVRDLPGTASRCGKTEPRCLIMAALHGRALPGSCTAARGGGFVSDNDIIDSLEWDQHHSMSVISRNSLKPYVHYGTEPLFLRLASSLVFKPAPKAFWGTNLAKSRLFHPELDAELYLGE